MYLSIHPSIHPSMDHGSIDIDMICECQLTEKVEETEMLSS